MSYQALYRAWRPNTFSEICGQDAVVQTLRRQVETGHIAHAYLFCGTRGTGKTTASKVLARAINCLNPKNGDPCGECEICLALRGESCMDVNEIDAASNNGVDEIRELRDKIAYPPTVARYKVYIIDEVHMLSSGAFNALLKTLEEPPKHAVFILATTEPQKLPATILSRCQRFDFRRISVGDIVARLKVVLNGIRREADEDALSEIARAAEGAMRDALSLLDVCLSFTDGKVDAALARDVLGVTGRDFMFEFTDALIAFDSASALAKIDQAMHRGSDPRVFAMDTAMHLRNILLASYAGESIAEIAEITAEDGQRFIEQAKNASEDQLLRAMELFMRVESEMKFSTQARTMLELASVRACHPEQEEESHLAERVARVEKMLREGNFTAKPLPEKPVAEKPAAGQTPKAKVSAPKAKPPQEYVSAIERISAENPSIRNMLDKMYFAGIENNVVSVEFPSGAMMVKPLLERKMAIFEQALSDAFGMPMTMRMSVQGKAPAKASAQTRSIIEQSYDVFGRDKIELTDD